jgi:GDP/UDP-N,N'-diacetylbacillosamine 2-epimerase (hydrolysing)
VVKRKVKICVVTGTRAEYGLLRYLMEAIRDSTKLELQLIVTGMHLSPEFGLTYREIESHGFTIDRKIEMLLSSDTPVGTAKATGLGTIGMADAIDQLAPDLMVVLGDRFEVFAAVTASLFAKVPVAHIHGGETTLGAFDEGMRHAITKMSHLHFVAAEQYRRRVIQLGEIPENVFNVGGLGVDAIKRTTILSREALEESLAFQFGEHNLLITLHPTTLDQSSPDFQWRELAVVLDEMPKVKCIITKPNSDPGNYGITHSIDQYVNRNPERCISVTSLGTQRYWSLMAQVDAVIGNSSSGLLEAPAFKVATLDIGDRQAGRIRADSVIHCDSSSDSIRAGMKRLFSTDFQELLPRTKNPYGEGGAVTSILKELESFHGMERIIQKPFRDLPSSAFN